MKILLVVLLAWFGFAGAQTTAVTCPKPPESFLCLLGLKNTCTNDSGCEPGTLCCNDGCRMRCRDPSHFSRGAREFKPRPGVCPTLSPPSQFCPSHFDECQFDWDCVDSTKKCCTNGCYKVCAEPGVGAVLDMCPAPAKLRECHFGLGNQCVNHSQCDYIENGLCCFDGCRRRCAGPEGFEARVEAPRPGRCPILPDPEICISDSDECELDGDCFPGKKCCSNNCFSRCVDPQNDDVGQLGELSGEAAGKCPVLSNSHCHIGLTHACNYDEECPSKMYCCFDGCRRQCLTTDKNSSGAFKGMKNGTCPVLQAPEPCASDIDACFLDSDCVGDQLCCTNGCSKVCVAPSEAGAAAAEKCPEAFRHHCPASYEHLCDNSSVCFTGMVCCFDGCRRRCVPPEGTPDTCPAPPNNMLCKVGLRNTCVDDSSCKPGTLCCKDGCRKRCRDPSSFGQGAEEVVPRLGVCPTLSPPSLCVADNDECQFDWDCAGSTAKCCSNNCFRVCAEPGVGALQDRCPAPHNATKCHMGLRNVCYKDSDCDYIGNGLCCFDGCRRRCASPEGFEAAIPTERPGRCPMLIPPEFCVSHADECQFDNDCYPGKKCCSNDCFNSCVDPELELLGSASIIRRCPIPSNTTRCTISLVHTCNTDKECPDDVYCCFDGCRRRCLDPEDRSKARPGGEEKSGTCPALPAPEDCASDSDECFIDWDCVRDQKCCSNGCNNQCVAPSNDEVAAAVKCPEPVVRECARSLKHTCDDSNVCSSGRVCCFDGCRRRCVSKQGGLHEGITVTCSKDEMQIDVERDVLDGFRSVFLRLNDPTCKATENGSHFTLVAPLMKCGTISRFTEDSVVYSNDVQDKEAELEGIITRMPELSIPFSCFYTKEGVTSTSGLIPSKVKMTMDGGDTTTEFVLEMSVFKDQQYQLPYGIRDFPLKVSLRKPLYVQVSVDSSDTRLTIREERCYATPTQNPDDKMQYDIIRDGCIVDSTVTYYPAPVGVRRFSFSTFQFTGNNGNFVYLHCDLVVCNASNPTSRCSVGCLSFPRKRRGLNVPGEARAALTEGPFMLGKEPVAKSRAQDSVSTLNLNTWLVIAMAAFCALCLGIIVYMKVKPSAKPKMDPDRETYI